MINGIQGLLADAAPQMADQGFEQTLVMIGVAFLFFYILIMRPETKKRKELEKKRQELKKGDTIIVAGGILAKVHRIQENSIIVKLYDGAEMEVLKLAVQDVQPIVSAVESPTQK